MTTPCRHARWTETYLDGELSPENTVDFEEHVSACCSCQCRLKFEQALRFSMRRATRMATYPSEGFEARLRALMTVEAQAETPTATDQSTASPTRHARPLTWRAIAPLSVAAAAALVFAAMRNEPGTTTLNQVQAGATGNNVAAKDTMQTVQEFLDQLATETEENVGLSEPVMGPMRPAPLINVTSNKRWPLPKFENLGDLLESLRADHLPSHGRQSSLHYRIGGHRVSLWTYDSKRVPLRVVLEPHVARNQPVFVGTHHGFAVAAVERKGLGLVATTDLSQSEAAEIIATAAIH